MNNLSTTNNSEIPMQVPGMFFIRMLLGIILFMQGYGKVFTIGMGKVYGMFFKVFENTFLPAWLIVSTAYFTSYVELFGGLLLIIGLFRKQVLYLFAIDLLTVSFGHGLLEPVWDVSNVMPRAILLAALFFLPAEWDKWNIDFFIKKNRIKK